MHMSNEQPLHTPHKSQDTGCVTVQARKQGVFLMWYIATPIHDWALQLEMLVVLAICKVQYIVYC